MTVKTYLIVLMLFLSRLIANSNEEFRSIWVITWEHINRYNTVSQNKAKVRKIMDDAKAANMNAILWQARQSGTAYYNSAYEPWGYYAGGEYPGYDPLQYAIEEAHKRGIELHAWFNVFHASSMVSGAPAAENPTWVCTNEDGQYMTSHRSLSPGLHAVRDYTINVAMEIVNNYDIDGLHLDYVRWSEYDEDDMKNPPDIIDQISKLDGDISQEKLNSLAKTGGIKRYIYDVNHPASGGIPSGFDSWDDWRRWSVTEFVHTLHDSIKAMKPWVRLSPAALGKYKAGGEGGWNGYYVVFQDAGLWFNEGYIDQLTPMHYHWLTGNSMKAELQSDWEPNIGPGISTGRLYSNGPGSYRLQEEGVWDNHEDIVNKVRTLSWVDGFQFFSYQRWEDYKYWTEAKEKFFNRKTKIRAASYMLANDPAFPSITLTKQDSLNYQIEVVPDASISENQWFAVYRSVDTSFSRDTDHILDIHFGLDSYTITDQVSGLQDFNGKYTYFATMLDRVWNESAISNTEISDSIPSFAPTVAETTPAEGGEIPLNGSLSIQFSKTIDTSTVNGALHIDPPAELAIPLWSNGNKTMRIKFNEYLQLGTDYILTLDSTIKDINGKPLDGNEDGHGGDSFIFNFRVQDLDDVPPHIIAASPATPEAAQNFYYQDIITVRFDELIDDASLDENSVVIYDYPAIIPSKFTHLQQDGQSVINLQPESPLTPDKEGYMALFKNTITDTSGNAMEDHFTISINTIPKINSETIMIDNFLSPGAWWQPNGSGSTKGIRVSETEFGFTSENYLPAAAYPKSAYLKYFWEYDSTDPGYLIREYLPPNDPKNKEFDTTYVLQTYLYGDGSNNKFRFCIDEYDGSNWTDHEVSKWTTIDWTGWKLVEWTLSDSNSVGSWISSDDKLTGEKFRIDSYQFTHDSTGAEIGKLYFADFRLVKKDRYITDIFSGDNNIPNEYTLYQNYPNPFNPLTTIPFYLPEAGKISLKVYNTLGQVVAVIADGFFAAGEHRIKFDGTNLASGLYIYVLKNNKTQLKQKMILVK